jgi:hypothetical protein
MIKYSIIIPMLIALILSATAKPESFSLGQYKVSFDLNRAEDHEISIAKPMYSATFRDIPYVGYGAQIIQFEPQYNLITIVVMEYKSPINLESADETTKRLLSNNGGCEEIMTSQYTIDGHQGYLTSSKKCQNDTQGFIAQYLLDGAKGSGSIECLIASTYPWNDGTLSLLKTIHIEKQSGS